MDEIIPHNKSAEEAVVGSIIINPQSLEEVSSYINSKSFYVDRNRMIWEAIESISSRGDDIDFLTVSQELDKRGQLADIGGMSYITSIINNVPSSIHCLSYARIIEKEYIRRRLISSASEIARLAYSEEEPEDAVRKSETIVGGIYKDSISMSSRGFNSHAIDEEFRIAIRNPNISLKSHIPRLDESIGGFFPRTSTIIAGTPGVGKTSLCLQICKSVAFSGRKALFISLEMSRVSLWARMACPEAGLEWTRVRDGNISENDLVVLSEISRVLADKLGDDNFIIEDEVYNLSGIHKSVLSHKPELVVVDNMSEIIKTDSSISNVVWFGEVAGYLRHIARVAKIPIIVIHHLKRAEERQDKRPQLTDLKWSGDIERVADVVLMPHREDLYTGRQPGVYQVPCEIWIRKNREGEGSACVYLSYDLKQQWFS